MVNEKDWKLFRKKLPHWQENFIEKLNKEYMKLLSNNEIAPSCKFWELEKRILSDKKKVGVSCEMRRSIMIDNIVSLILEGAITIEDINDFSDGLKESVLLIVNKYVK